MDKAAIHKTAICTWSDDDAGYVVQSPLLTMVIGVGDTLAEAWQIFNEILEDAHAAYKAGKLKESIISGIPNDNLLIHTDKPPRQGWEASFADMAKHGDG